MYKSLLTTTNNTRVVSGKIWRSDVVAHITPEDEEMLKAKGMTTVIDLRNEDEVTKCPCALKDKADFEYHNFPIAEGAMPPPTLEGVPSSYMRIAGSKNIGNVFRTIAHARDGVIFGCTAGKDRTGVVTAVLRLLAGDEDETIIKDYAVSREYNKKRLEAFLAEHPEFDRSVIMAQEVSMERFLELFRERYVSAEDYLQGLGLDDKEIQAIRDKLII